MQCFLLLLHVCCVTHMRFQGNISIGSSRWIAIPYENMFTCSIKPIDVLIFSSIKVCFSLLLLLLRSFTLLVLPSANLFFPPFDGFTVSFLLPCAKIVKEEVRPALPFIRLVECRQLTHLRAIVSGCLQIHSDTAVSVTVSSCFQGYLCNQEN